MKNVYDDYKHLMKIYIHLKKETESYDKDIAKLKKEFKNTLKKIKIAKKNETLNKLYSQGLKIINNISELMTKRSIVSRKKTIEHHFEEISKRLYNKEYDIAEKELAIVKNMILNPPVKFYKVNNILSNQLYSQYEKRQEKMFYKKIMRPHPVEIVMDKDVAIISGDKTETIASSFVVNKLSKIANQKIKVGEIPVYATVQSDNKFINLTIIEREITDRGIIANRNFIKVTKDFIK
ncbi:hypothetical protein J7J90_00690 [Candidatus Micrarchaeota archaeon]|nr:hypothetical protein [Candidatus Micrarchaeota archaeon]